MTTSLSVSAFGLWRHEVRKGHRYSLRLHYVFDADGAEISEVSEDEEPGNPSTWPGFDERGTKERIRAAFDVDVWSRNAIEITALDDAK